MGTLTDTHKRVLSLLVDAVRKRKVPEKFTVRWHLDGTGYITGSTLGLARHRVHDLTGLCCDVLTREGLLLSRPTFRRITDGNIETEVETRRTCIITPEAYLAVDSNFVSMPGSMASDQQPVRKTVVISWSKPLSRAVASFLTKWLPSVIPSIHLWMSDNDLTKGTIWFDDLHTALSRAQVCITCVTPENAWSPWIYYEAGFIAAKDPHVLVCPYLVGVTSEVLGDGPLGLRQHTIANRIDTLRLIDTLYRTINSVERCPDDIRRDFDARWPALDEQLRCILESHATSTDGPVMTDADGVAGVKLSLEARMLIVEVAKDHQGHLSKVDNGGYLSLHTNNKELVEHNATARKVARWRTAFNSLLSYNVFEDQGNGWIYKLTQSGFEIADELEMPLDDQP